MKGLGPAAATAAPAGKRRWRCVVATGAALALVFFSVVVPLAVLLGLHKRFPSSPYLPPSPKTLPFSYSLEVPLASRIQAFRPVCGREHDLGASQLVTRCFYSNSVGFFGLCSVLGRRKRGVGECRLNLII